MIQLPEIQEINKRYSDSLLTRWEEVHGPLGGHGLLGFWSWWMGCMPGKLQSNLQPNLLLLFLGGHGFGQVWKGASSTVPMEEHVVQFIRGESPLRQMAQKIHSAVTMVDCGTAYAYERDPDYWLYQHDHFLVRKVGEGTRHVGEFACMTTEQHEAAVSHGMELAKKFSQKRIKVVGISHVDPLSVWSALLVYAVHKGKRPSELAWPSRPGEEAMRQLNRWAIMHPKAKDLHATITLYGGFELSTMLGFILQAAALKLPVVLDGPVAQVAGRLACELDGKCMGYMLTAGGMPFEAPNPAATQSVGQPGTGFYMQLAGFNLANQMFK